MPKVNRNYYNYNKGLTETEKIIHATGNRRTFSPDAVITVYLSALLLLTIMVSSCHKQKPVDPQPVFLFGVAESQPCVFPSCNQYFVMMDDHLYRASGQYDSGPLVISPSPLPEKNYQLARLLKEEIPPYLLERPYRLFGTAEPQQSQKIHIEFMAADSRYKWAVHTADITLLEPSVRDYILRMLEVIQEINA